MSFMELATPFYGKIVLPLSPITAPGVMNLSPSTPPPPSTASTHVNVMETLVHEEIEKQLRFYPKTLRTYLNLTEVATYALNRLPPLYASSVKGVEEQRRVAVRRYSSELTSAVRRAIAAVERDPLRNSTPIVSELEVKYQEAENTLSEIQQILKNYNLLDYGNQQVTWENCAHLVRKAFAKLMAFKQSPPPVYPPPPLPPRPSQAPRGNTPIDPKSTLW